VRSSRRCRLSAPTVFDILPLRILSLFGNVVAIIHFARISVGAPVRAGSGLSGKASPAQAESQAHRYVCTWCAPATPPHIASRAHWHMLSLRLASWFRRASPLPNEIHVHLSRRLTPPPPHMFR
jgi:hypothetical protein